MQIFQLRKIVKAELERCGTDGAEAVSRILFCDILNCTPTELLLNGSKELNEAEERRIREAAAYVGKGGPVQYATGKAYFDGAYFKVDERVLIPRPETEELVDWVSEEIVGEAKVLDIGTGSGCIAVSVKRRCKAAQVKAIDVSPSALEVARLNATQNAVSVTFEQCDILKSCPQGEYDVVVSNPPYVREKEREAMHKNVLEHEPWQALFVSDDDPLVFYRAIARHCQGGMLREGGVLFFEINEALGRETVEMLVNEGFSRVELRQDAFGRDRMVRARR